MSHFGLDVSSNNFHPIRWKDLYSVLAARGEGGQPFVAVKLTEGDWYINPYAYIDATAARDAGFAVCFYMFFHGNLSPAIQQSYFEAHNKMGLPQMNDIETPDNLSQAEYGHAATELAALNPSALSYMDGNNAWSGYFPVHALWLAYPSNIPGYRAPGVPLTSPGLTIHQYWWNGTFPGVGGHFDLDFWMGTEAEFDSFFHSTVASASPTSTTSTTTVTTNAPTTSSRKLKEQDIMFLAQPTSPTGATVWLVSNNARVAVANPAALKQYQDILSAMGLPTTIFPLDGDQLGKYPVVESKAAAPAPITLKVQAIN